jgi:hypothetical protein
MTIKYTSKSRPDSGTSAPFIDVQEWEAELAEEPYHATCQFVQVQSYSEEEDLKQALTAIEPLSMSDDDGDRDCVLLVRHIAGSLYEMLDALRTHFHGDHLVVHVDKIPSMVAVRLGLLRIGSFWVAEAYGTSDRTTEYLNALPGIARDEGGTFDPSEDFFIHLPNNKTLLGIGVVSSSGELSIEIEDPSCSSLN